MKVLFIYPNDYLCIGIPTGIATLSAMLKQAGHKVDLFDHTFIKIKDYQQPEYGNKGVFLPTAYTIDDLVADDPVQTIAGAFMDKLKSFSPDLIVVSIMTGYFDKVLDLLKQVKPSCPVIVGGVHATIWPQDALKYDEIDFICVGEGEEMLLELCDCLANNKDYLGIKNLGYKKDGQIKINELRKFVDINKLPTPDWSLFDKRHLFRPFMGKIYKGSFYVMSRGCLMQCTYCVNGSLREAQKGCGNYFRYQSAATTIKQLSELKEKYGATWFKFADDSITMLSEEYLEELAEGLVPLNIMFGCSIRPETITRKKVELLKKMGCIAATVGVESGNQELRSKILNRHMKDQDIIKAVSLLQEAGIRVSAFNMIGLPEETRENVFETIRLNKKLKASAVNVYIMYPYHGTGIQKKYNINIRDYEGKLIPVEKASSFNLSNMEPKEVEGLLKTFDIYLKLPEEMWPKVKLAEGDSEEAEKLRHDLRKYANSLKQK